MTSTKRSPDKPKIRITTIIAVLDMADTLQKAIDSVLLQDYDNKELIIIDGGSTDETIKIIKKNQSLIDYWECYEKKGIYRAWNRALAHATGEWIHFLGADDYFPANNIFSHMLPYMHSANNEIRLIYGKIAIINQNGEIKSLVGKDWSTARKALRKRMPIPHPGVFHHHSIFKKHGLFNESFRISGDYEFLLRELKFGEAQFVPDIVVKHMRIGGLSLYWRNDFTRVFENAKARRLNGMPAYTIWWGIMLVKSLLRNIFFKILIYSRKLI